MHVILTIFAFMIMLGIIVTAHEFGHFIAAKKFGVYVHEFSLGMGPKLFSRKGKETVYTLRALPIGGFVSMAGEEVNKNSEKDLCIPVDRQFYSKPYWQKIIILLAGVTMNFILAITLFSILVGISGTYTAPIKPVVSEVIADYPAERAGILQGDQIVAISFEGRTISIETIDDMTTMMHDKTDTDMLSYTILRNGQQFEVSVTPQFDENSGRYLFGITSASTETVEVKWYNAPWYGMRYAYDQFSSMIRSFRMLFMPNGMNYMSGPVGIASVTGQVVSYGFLSYLALVALISLNIGIVNLLPLPVLDGGQAVMETIQRLCRRTIPAKVKYAIMTSCWILLLGLVVYVSVNDIIKLF